MIADRLVDKSWQVFRDLPTCAWWILQRGGGEYNPGAKVFIGSTIFGLNAGRINPPLPAGSDSSCRVLKRDNLTGAWSDSVAVSGAAVIVLTTRVVNQGV